MTTGSIILVTGRAGTRAAGAAGDLVIEGVEDFTVALGGTFTLSLTVIFLVGTLADALTVALAGVFAVFLTADLGAGFDFAAVLADLMTFATTLTFGAIFDATLEEDLTTTFLAVVFTDLAETALLPAVFLTTTLAVDFATVLAFLTVANVISPNASV